MDLENFRVDKTPIMIRSDEMGLNNRCDHVSMTPFCGGRLVVLMEEYHLFEGDEKFIQLGILDLSTSMDLKHAYR